MLQSLKLWHRTYFTELLKISPKMRYGIQIWTLWWLFKITHILVWFPLFHCICPMTWGVIILGNKVVAIYKKLKVLQLLIMRMSKYSPLLMLPLRWVKNPEPLFYMHPWQSHHHHQILLSVRQNCSCRPYGWTCTTVDGDVAADDMWNRGVYW